MPLLLKHLLATMPITLLAFLLALDALALMGQLAGSIGAYLGVVPRTPYYLRLEEAYGFASLATYGKWLAIAVLLALAWRGVRQPLLLSLSLVFLLLFVEDSLELHEQLGTALQSTLGLDDRLGLRGADLGELGAWALVGLPCMLVLAHGYARSSAEARRLGHVFFLGLSGLAFFGVAVDLVSALAAELDPSFGSRLLRLALRLTEEGGELVIASLLVAFAHAIWRARLAKRHPPMLVDGAEPATATARPALLAARGMRAAGRAV